MRRLAILCVATITAVGLVGVSCSSSKTETNGSGGATAAGGSENGGTTGTGTSVGGATSATGGKSSTGTGTSTAATGGVTSTTTGGTTSQNPQGGSTSASGGATAATGGGSPLTGGVATPGQYYTQSTLMGSTWTAKDADGSTITMATGEMCVTGNIVKIPMIDGSTTYDYGGAWGVDVGWNLDQTAGVDGGAAGAQNPADVSALTSLTVALNGATGLTLRVQLEVKDADSGTSAYYCASLPAAGGTVNLADLKTQCWGTTGNVAFDKDTMQPISFAIQVVTDTTAAHPFNFCVTTLTFQ
jgi:hypothetical protein